MQIRPSVLAAPRFGSSARAPLSLSNSSGADAGEVKGPKCDINPEYVTLRDCIIQTGKNLKDPGFRKENPNLERTPDGYTRQTLPKISRDHSTGRLVEIISDGAQFKSRYSFGNDPCSGGCVRVAVLDCQSRDHGSVNFEIVHANPEIKNKNIVITGYPERIIKDWEDRGVSLQGRLGS